jgi:hypothetical protein
MLRPFLFANDCRCFVAAAVSFLQNFLSRFPILGYIACDAGNKQRSCMAPLLLSFNHSADAALTVTTKGEPLWFLRI